MEKYVDIIKALRRKAEDQASTEAEIMEAIAQAEKLMAKHQITEAQLKRMTATEGMREGGHDNRLKTRHPVNKYCITSISAFSRLQLSPSFRFPISTETPILCSFLFFSLDESLGQLTAPAYS